MNGNKHLKKHDTTETGTAVIILYRHYFTEAELHSINKAKCRQ
ncbi:hypothetical protein PG5_40320 [Pseudomonas sp. G5(2012)]|nr:hypothetical protein PG5_40320 [Pseudomonas sp. G5(2012)]